MSLWTELKRRNVYRVGAAYAIVAWVLVQVASVFVPALNLPSSVVSFLAFIALLGLPVVLVVAWLYDVTPEGLKRTDAAPQDPAVAQLKAQRLNYVMIGAVIAAVALIAVDRFVSSDGAATVAAETAAGAASAAAPPIAPPAQATTDAMLPNSVAVLPFANLSPNADDAYFAQGMHEEVLNQLFKLGKLNVIARTSVLRYANTEMPIPEIARELNVKTVMEGSVRYAGDDVRITAQLIDPATGAHLWSEAYQRKIDDVFAIQADIAMNIANALRAEFSLEEQRAIEQPPTSSPEAYELYLRARALAIDNAAVAHELLDQAIALDPDFAAAYAVKARIYSTLLGNNVAGNAVRPEQREATLRQVREYADRALALAPAEPLALAVLGTLDVQQWRWSQLSAGKDMRSAFNPATVWVHAWAGNPQLILPASEQWTRLDPNVSGTHLNLGVLYAYAADLERSNRSFRRAVELAPANVLARAWIAYNAAAAGDVERAFAELQSVERVLGENPPIVFLPELGYAYGRIGRADDARRFFTRLEAAGKERDIGTGSWALGYLAIGDEQRALEQLELAATKARNHEPDVAYLNLMNLKMNFLNDPRVTTPRFAEVLGRIRGD
jgi:adenylate cyclase